MEIRFGGVLSVSRGRAFCYTDSTAPLLRWQSGETMDQFYKYYVALNTLREPHLSILWMRYYLCLHLYESTVYSSNHRFQFVFVILTITSWTGYWVTWYMTSSVHSNVRSYLHLMTAVLTAFLPVPIVPPFSGREDVRVLRSQESQPRWCREYRLLSHSNCVCSLLPTHRVSVHVAKHVNSALLWGYSTRKIYWFSGILNCACTFIWLL